VGYNPYDKIKKGVYHMTDITKYKNVSLSHKTYDLIDKIRKVIQPDTVLSRSQTISILVNEKARKLNGKVKEK
jgi:hypothetical protein